QGRGWQKNKKQGWQKQGQGLQMQGQGQGKGKGKANVVDGNIERIFSRVEKLEKLFPVAKTELYEIAHKYLPKSRFGDYAQALMDLGATICKPQKPKCGECPIADLCTLAFNEKVENYPQKTPKRAKKQLKAHIFWVEKSQKTPKSAKMEQKTASKALVLMQKRPEKGLLGNMIEFPSTDWVEENVEFNVTSANNIGSVTHIFTHIKLVLQVWKIDEISFQKMQANGLNINIYSEQKWVSVNEFEKHAIPSLMQKIIQLVEDKKQEPTLI
ncbi:MAG: NUDIX domain-containing protein, partial [Rhizobiales bacterium]|nr:NUDIX domain-containing protein [Hyphomicrobiales bacterium]